MAMPSEYISMGPAYSRKGLQTAVRLPPPEVQWGGLDCSAPRAGSGDGTGSSLPVGEGGHRTCSSARQRVRVLQPVLRSSKEGWGVASNFRSATLESFSQEIQVQDAHYSYHHESDQIRGLVCHDRSKGRILPCFHHSFSQEVPEVRFRGRSVPVPGSSVWPSSLPSHFHQVHGCSSSTTEASGHPCAELYRRLAYIGPVSGDGSSASRCRPWPHSELGVETQHGKERVVARPENHVPGGGMGLDNDAGTIVSRSYRVHPGEGFLDKARPRYHCKAVPKTAGAHGSCVQRNTFWPSVHETPTVVVENQGVFLERESVPYDQGHAPMPSCPVHMEETLVSVPRPSIGSVMSPKSHFDRLIPYGLGHGHGWPLCERSVAGPAFLIAHKLSGNASGLQGSEELSPRSQRSPCPNTSRQYVSGLVFEPSGGSEVTPSVQIGTPDPPVVQGETVVSQSDVCPRGPESGSRRPVEAGVEARGMETSPRGGEVDMREVRPSVSVCHVSVEEERLHLLCPVRALNIFIHKSSHWRRSEQLLVCFGSPKKGLPASKQTISNWIIQANTLAYQVRGLPSPVTLRAHSTRGMVSCRALLSGVPLQEICDAAGWSTTHTFIRFYSLYLPSTPGARVLSS